MELTIIRNINHIIERDSKDATYKFALLRGVVDSIQEYGHFSRVSGDRVILSTGVLTFQWLLYYYPIIASPVFIPQRNGETEEGNHLVFRDQFKVVTDYFATRGGHSVFFDSLRKGRVDVAIQDQVCSLIRTVTNTIIKQPMRYIGFSISGEHYHLFQKEEGTSGRLQASLESMIACCGTYSIPLAYHEAFEYLGGIITGKNSILFEWANFTASRPGVEISREQILQQLLEYPTDKREVQLVENIYRSRLKETDVWCVWSGKKLTTATLNIDHILPFSAWKNNDLWNLIPVNNQINGQKSDKIPSPDFIDSRADPLKSVWGDIFHKHETLFRKDLEVGLVGQRFESLDDIMNASIEALKAKCGFLIEKRGMPVWKL